MTDITDDVSKLLRVLSSVISKSSGYLSNRHIATSLYGLQGMTSDNSAVRTVLLSLLSKTSKASHMEVILHTQQTQYLNSIFYFCNEKLIELEHTEPADDRPGNRNGLSWSKRNE